MSPQVPDSCSACCLELCTDSDKYKLEFYEGSTNEEKANTIGLALLMDYMFFERDLGIVTCATNDQGKPVIKCTFCLMFIYGCICPCSGTIVLDGSGASGVGGPASPDEWEPEEEWLRNYMRNVKMHRG